MFKLNFIISAAAFLLVCFSVNSPAQEAPRAKRQTERSYEMVLQILTASDSAADSRQAVPQTLSGVVKKLKNTFAYSNYRLTSTYLQRIANTGNMDFKGVSAEPNKDVYAPVFSDWTIGQLTAFPYIEPQNFVSIQNFRFGQRIPVKTGGFQENNKSNSPVNYEAIGLSTQKIDLPVNTPTLIGTLSTSKSDELLFLILTVKPTDE